MQEDPDKYLLPHCNFSFFKMLNHFDQNLQGSQTLQDLAEGKQKLYKSQDLIVGVYLEFVCCCLFLAALLGSVGASRSSELSTDPELAPALTAQQEPTCAALQTGSA